ncbi:MAG TPA: AAA family ATPase [Thermoanaerobaculia bacterium]|nr:AAA family ATPase [Thermoanaerobaculia bacterium]
MVEETRAASERTAAGASAESLAEAARRIRERLTAHLPGLDAAVDELLAAYLAGGHALLEGVPGIGKTLLARSFAAALGRVFKRLQFTPDLMPADVVGSNVFDPQAGGFHLVQGPVFTEILMADEVNRTPPKTQAALLEAMQERQVTIDGTAHPLAAGFFVVATQNPVEYEGTYPLPEAQLDRFLLRIEMTAPPREAELELYRRAVGGSLAGWRNDALEIPAAVSGAEAAALRAASASVHVAGELLAYLLALAEAVRRSPHVELGPSPRGALSLLEAARAWALLQERDFVVPDDLKRMLVPCWGHRMLLVAEAELEGRTARGVLEEVAAAVEAPHGGAGGEASSAGGAVSAGAGARGPAATRSGRPA